MTTETIANLPHLQAILNTITLVLLMTGYYFIRNNNRKAHIICMLSATIISALFLTSYLIYHAKVGFLPFTGQGLIRPIYFSILASHVILAALNVPLVLTTVGVALWGKINIHRKLVRWTLPIWTYVSATGLIVYLLAYHLYPHTI